MHSPVNAVLTKNQKHYIERRTLRAMRTLSHKVREVNPALSVSMKIDPYDQIMTIEIVQKNATKHGVRHVHTLKGEYQLYWNFGKRLSLYIPDMQNPRSHEVHFHRRGAIAGNQLFALVKDHLPKRDLSQKFRLVSFVDEGRVQLRDHEEKPENRNARQKMRSRQKPVGSRTNVVHFQEPHIKFVTKRILNVEKVFRDRTRHLFDNVELEPTFETDVNNVTRPRLNLRLRPKPKHHQRGTPKEIWIAGDLALQWRANDGNGARLDFTPTDIQSVKGSRFQSINLTRKSADIVREVYNFLVAGKMLVNTSKKNRVEGGKVETAAEPQPESRRNNREKYRRPKTYQGRQGNSGNFTAVIKSGHIPGYTR